MAEVEVRSAGLFHRNFKVYVILGSRITQTLSESRTSARHGGDQPPQQKLLVKGALLDGSAYVANEDQDRREVEHDAAA